jgi:small subunit ribosomal protein S18
MAEESKTATPAAEAPRESPRTESPRAESPRTESTRTESTRPEGRSEGRSEGRFAPRGPRPGGGPGGPREGGRKYFRRKKVCKFCVEKIEAINYKDVRLLSQFVAESGKIVPRRLTGVCTPHQRRLSSAIKQARNIALLPYAGRP